MHHRNPFEKGLEWLLFQSRWLMAPVYIGLVLSLIMLLTAFIGEIVEALPHVIGMKTEEVLLTVLSLIDLSLGLNLVLIVVFSGYENFVSKIDTGNSEIALIATMEPISFIFMPEKSSVPIHCGRSSLL